VPLIWLHRSTSFVTSAWCTAVENLFQLVGLEVSTPHPKHQDIQDLAKVLLGSLLEEAAESDLDKEAKVYGVQEIYLQLRISDKTICGRSSLVLICFRKLGERSCAMNLLERRRALDIRLVSS